MIPPSRRIMEAAARCAATFLVSLGMLLASCTTGGPGQAGPPEITPRAPREASLAAAESRTAAAGTMAAASAMPLEGTATPVLLTDHACPVTEPEWAKPPEDAAVQDPPAYAHYFVNEDRSMWASAWGAGPGEYPFRASKEGIKMGWFRPAGAPLEITGRRLDAPAPPLEAHASCCYPTRFQASGVYFPTEGCWEVTAKAAGSQLTFVVRVRP